jgi:hypothetical protein
MSGKCLIQLLLVAAALCGAHAGAADPESHWDRSISVTPVAKNDNGLGAAGHYSTWQEPWLYLTPAEKIDSGLGELPPLSERKEPWLYATPAAKPESGIGQAPAGDPATVGHAKAPPAGG